MMETMWKKQHGDIFDFCLHDSGLMQNEKIISECLMQKPRGLFFDEISMTSSKAFVEKSSEHVNLMSSISVQKSYYLVDRNRSSYDLI